MRPHSWDRFGIMRALHERGTNLTRLAEKRGINPSACRVAVHRPELGGEIAIAECLGVDPSELWPERYVQPLSWARSNALTKFRKRLAVIKPRSADRVAP